MSAQVGVCLGGSAWGYVQGGCAPPAHFMFGYTPLCGQTDTYENITLPQTSFACGKKSTFACQDRKCQMSKSLIAIHTSIQTTQFKSV